MTGVGDKRTDLVYDLSLMLANKRRVGEFHLILPDWTKLDPPPIVELLAFDMHGNPVPEY
jgi:hypothetical protein